MRLLLICVIIGAALGVAAAQGAPTKSSGVPAPVALDPGENAKPPSPLIERMGKDPDAYSRSVTGTIVTIDGARRSLVLQGQGKTPLTFVVDSKVRVRADKDTALGGKKDLSLSDYSPGQFVRVTYRIEDSKALEIRLKRPRS